ncbi:MAG TPA: MerR family transcriptional regulator [Bacteriovoracaceae bacterium]|nr:MerR family transcriptional regulator [Bacteriovoracaceae bacterium]
MIPNKSTFKFQELTPITGVKPYVIRFWETEFVEIAPVMSDSGTKLYARKDVEAILRIKKLLFEDKLSVPEAKAKMGLVENDEEAFHPEESMAKDFNDVREYLLKSLDLIHEIKYKRNW